MSPSPIRAEHQRSTICSSADPTAIPATATASQTMTSTSPASTPSSMIRWNSSSGATDSALLTITVMRKTMMRPLKGEP